MTSPLRPYQIAAVAAMSALFEGRIMVVTTPSLQGKPSRYPLGGVRRRRLCAV